MRIGGCPIVRARNDDHAHSYPNSNSNSNAGAEDLCGGE